MYLNCILPLIFWLFLIIHFLSQWSKKIWAGSGINFPSPYDLPCASCLILHFTQRTILSLLSLTSGSGWLSLNQIILGWGCPFIVTHVPIWQTTTKEAGLRMCIFKDDIKLDTHTHTHTKRRTHRHIHTSELVVTPTEIAWLDGFVRTGFSGATKVGIEKRENILKLLFTASRNRDTSAQRHYYIITPSGGILN